MIGSTEGRTGAPFSSLYHRQTPSRAGGSPGPQAGIAPPLDENGAALLYVNKHLCVFSASFAVNLQMQQGSHPRHSRAGGSPERPENKNIMPREIKHFNGLHNNLYFVLFNI